MSLSTTQYGYIVDPMVPFTDDKGKTIKNGFIRVFMAGTSTPVITYRNYDGSTNQEKIELDNSGRVKHNVIGSKGSLYKVVVYNILHSQENPLLTVDKIAVLGASINASGATIVTGLDNVEGESDGFVKAEMVGTTAIVKLDATNVSNELTGDAAVSYAAIAGYMVPVLSNDSEEPGDPQKLALEWLWNNRSKQVVLEPSDFIETGLSNDEWAAAIAAVGSGKTVVVKWTESDALRFAFSSRYEVGVSLVFVCEFGGYVTEYVVAAASNAHAVTTNVYELAGSHSITKFEVMWDAEESDYVFPAPQDVIQAVNEYIDVQLVFNALAGYKFVYSLTYKSGTKYEWTREDCRVKFNLTRVSDYPLIWAWSAGDTSLKQDINKLSDSIAQEFDPEREETYTAGTLVMHEGELREFTADHPTGPWISGDNKAANVAGKFGKLNAGESLTDAASITVPNNALSTLSSSQATITLNVNVAAGEVPNFAVEITAGAAITLTVTKTTGGVATTLKYAEAAGNALESGKMYQITCVGSCWTLAEFVAPGA